MSYITDFIAAMDAENKRRKSAMDNLDRYMLIYTTVGGVLLLIGCGTFNCWLIGAGVGVWVIGTLVGNCIWH